MNSRKMITLAAMSVVAAFTAFAANEPDSYVEWIGRSGTGPVINTGYAFTGLPRIEIGMTLSCGDCDIAGNSGEGSGKIVMNYTSSGQGFGYVRFCGLKNVTAQVSPVPTLDTTTFNTSSGERISTITAFWSPRRVRIPPIRPIPIPSSSSWHGNRIGIRASR